MRSDLKDVLILSVIRVTLLSVSYALVAQCSYKPYWYFTWLSSIGLIPYGIVRAAVTDLKPLGATLSLILTLIAFSVVHVIVAHATSKRLLRRANMGLSDFRLAWSEDDWQITASADSMNTNEAIVELLAADGEDIPRECLSDPDSHFMDCNGLSIHYKEERPAPGNETQMLDTSFAILLIHGFGGGVFSWRNIMRPLAETCGCRVVAFDCPAFGLTDRPRVIDPNNNPYRLQSQQKYVLELCKQLEIKKVMLVGHSDGCILALMLGAALNPLNTQIPQRVSDSARKLLKVSSVRREKDPVMIGLNICRRLSFEYPESQDQTTSRQTEDLESGKEVDFAIQGHSGLSILAVAFLHPDLSRDDGPSFTSLLRQSRITRRVLRPLLRSDIGEVCNRRAWYDSSKLTTEILDLYKGPLRIRGWDSALVAYTKEKRCLTNEDVRRLTQKVIGLPLLVLTGEKDRIVPPEKAIALAEELHAEHRSILPNCGHLSHEEVPDLLQHAIIEFVKYMCELYEDL
eukprot:g735.t1